MKNNRSAQLESLLKERIVILDGAMGTMIQGYKLDEAGYRGARFKDFARDLKGNNDLLTLTQPQIIREIHAAYFAAGADIIETNTFNSTSIAQADYALEHLVHELNVEAARLARAAADEFEQKDGRPRFVAGALGPTNRTASISPDVNDPAFRNVTFDQLVAAYTEAVHGLVEGGVDLLLVETIFDTLNAKAALFAIDEYFENARRAAADHHLGHDHRCLRAHAVGTDHGGVLEFGAPRDGRSRSGLNCALGAELMRPYIEEMSRVADTYVSAYPNAGLPNPLAETGYDETPQYTAGLIKEFAQSGFVNIVGGCCGTTPAHIKAIAEAVRGIAPRAVPELEKKTRLSGWSRSTSATTRCSSTSASAPTSPARRRSRA